MSLTENSGGNFTMPVTPMGGYGGGFGNGFGDGAWWLIVLLLFAGWGNNGWSNGGGNGGVGGLYPWMNSVQSTQNGFDQAATASALAGIQTSLTNGFSNAEVAACNRAMTDLQTSYNNQIASMNQNFANQQALAAQLNGMQAAQAQCCCENKALIADTKYTIATEACADRAAVSNALRDVIASNTANTQSVLNTIEGGIQAIKDQMCQDKIDAKNERIASLETQLNMQNLAASQAAQTAALVADNNAQTQHLIQRISPYPIPAYPVANPFGCGGYGFNGFGVA